MSLTETYNQKDKKPFGGYIARLQLDAMFYTNTIREKKESFTKTWNNIEGLDTASLYVCITPVLYVNDEEADAMMDYVHAGNDLFIAAGYIDKELMNRVGCKFDYNDWVTQSDPFGAMKNTTTSGTIKDSSTAYGYYYLPFQNSFSSLNDNNTKVLGRNEKQDPNFIVVFHGKGRLFLHCDPRAFSNYFLLKNDNYKYMKTVFGYTAIEPYHLYWDDYYNKVRYKKKNSSSKYRKRNGGGSGGGNGSSGGENSNNDEDKPDSFFDVINGNPALAFSFWIAFALLLLYILFGGKRRQRIIEKRKANENTTVTFTETIGRLYLQKRDNKNIADKMITYFNEYVRNNYFLNTSMVNADFITTLSRKSGVDHDRIEALYRSIDHAQQNSSIDDYQLLSLNEQIQHFYKIVK